MLIIFILPVKFSNIASLFPTFSTQNITGLDAGLDWKVCTAFNIDFKQSNFMNSVDPLRVKHNCIITTIMYSARLQ